MLTALSGGIDKVVRAQHPERDAHPRAAEKAPCLHDLFEETELIHSDEKAQFTGFGEIDPGREQRKACKSPILIARHRGGGKREQCAAKEIAGARIFALP